MSESTIADAITKESVAEIASRLSEPSWLVESRLGAWETYFQTPMPTEKDDGWRKVSIDSINLSGLKTYTLAAAERANEVKGTAWFQSALRHFPDYSGVLFQSTKESGRFTLNKELSAKGVVFCDIYTAVLEHADKIRPYLEASTNSSTDGKFGLLTRALFNCGMFLYVPRGVVIESPFFYGVDFNDILDGGALLPRILVVAEENSKVSLAYTVGSDDNSTSAGNQCLLSQYAEVHVKPGAKVSFLELQQYGPSVFTVSNSNCLVDRDGRYESLTLALGGGQTKSDMATILRAPGASSEVLGLVLGADNEKFSFNTIQDHAASDTKSDINFRVALKDSSSSLYQGIVRVAKVAQRTDAYQSNKNLLLDNRAKADSIPKLEILADDVKCSHGATVGPVDREQIFYLMSRGLTERVAEELVVLGFFRQILEKFPLAHTLEWLGEAVSRKILGAESQDLASNLFAAGGE